MGDRDEGGRERGREKLIKTAKDAKTVFFTKPLVKFGF